MGAAFIDEKVFNISEGKVFNAKIPICFFFSKRLYAGLHSLVDMRARPNLHPRNARTTRYIPRVEQALSHLLPFLAHNGGQMQ